MEYAKCWIIPVGTCTCIYLQPVLHSLTHSLVRNGGKEGVRRVEEGKEGKRRVRGG